jgi:hypothetical protein
VTTTRVGRRDDATGRAPFESIRIDFEFDSIERWVGV